MKKMPTSIYLDEAQQEAIPIVRNETGIPMQQQIRVALREYYKKHHAEILAQHNFDVTRL